MLNSLLENNVAVPFELYEARVDGFSLSSQDSLASLCARSDRPLRWLTVARSFPPVV